MPERMRRRSARRTRFSVVLEYFHPWPNAAGFYLARALGLYEAAGLAVEFRTADPFIGDGRAYLTAGLADAAIIPGNRLLAASDQGENLLGVAAINHRALEMIHALAGRGIARPADLARHRVALNPTKRGLAMLRHLVAQDGGDPNTITIIDTGPRELTPEDFARGEADASFGSYWAWEALLPSSIPIADRVTWPIDTIGAPPFHPYQLAISENLARNEPALVRAFLAATADGFHRAAAQPSLAAPLMERAIPFFPRDMIDRSLALIAPTWRDGDIWGRHREDKLATYADWLAAYAIIRDCNVWRHAATNDFLP